MLAVVRTVYTVVTIENIFFIYDSAHSNLKCDILLPAYILGDCQVLFSPSEHEFSVAKRCLQYNERRKECHGIFPSA